MTKAERAKRYYDSHREAIKFKTRRESQARRVAARKAIQEMKSVPCMDCGRSYPHYVMDLDHRDPSIKESTVARMVHSGRSLAAVLAEAAKCDVVCSNCHRMRTYGEQ